MLGTPYLVTGFNTAAGSTIASATVATTTTVGDAVSVWVCTNSASLVAVTDSQSNTYTAGTAVTNGTLHGGWFYSLNTNPLTAGSDTISATFTGTGGSKTISAIGCSGISNSGAVDLSIGTTGTSTAPSVTSSTSGAASELLLAGELNVNTPGAITWTDPTFSAALVTDTEHNGFGQYASVAAATTNVTGSFTAAGTIASSGAWGIALMSLTASAATGAGRVGATIPNLALETGPCSTDPAEPCYDAGMTQSAADARFTNAVQRGLLPGSNSTQLRLQVTKKFWSSINDYNTNKNDLSNYLQYGTKVMFALTPKPTGFTNSDKTLLANFLTAIKNMGYNANNCSIILWQEPENNNHFGGSVANGGYGGGPTAYQAAMQFYGPTVNASGLPLHQDVGMGSGDANAQSYLNAGFATTGITFAGVYVDFYYGAWNRGITLTNVAAIADAQGLPFGLGEFGMHVTDNYKAYFTYINNFFSARLQNGLVNNDIEYYQGQCSADGANDLTSPILNSTDPRIPHYQSLYDNLQAPRGANTVTVTSPGAQTNQAGAMISLQISASDSDITQTLTFSATGLPPGLSISSSGLISGAVDTPGTYNVTVTATDSTDASGSAGFSWTVTANTVTVTSPGTQTNTVNDSVNVTISATDSNTSLTSFTWAATGLPPNATINSSTGVITGTVTTAGTYGVTITATDVTGAVGSVGFSWAVNRVVTNTVTVTSPGNQTNTVGDTVNLTITATDSNVSITTFTWTDGGSLPAGLSINTSTGVITGHPTTAQVYTVTIRATDVTGSFGVTSFKWTVNPVTNTVTVSNPGNQSTQQGATVVLQMNASDSNVSITTFTWKASGLPGGLSIASGTGLITGSPTTPGNFSVSITATDATNSSGSAAFTWTITSPTVLSAGKFTTLPPVSPSPVGGLGPASQLSYEIAFGLVAGKNSTVPFCAVTLQFFDFDQNVKNQTPIGQVSFRCPMGTSGDPNGPAVVYGRGPIRGAFIQVRIHNVDTVDGTLAFMQLVGVSRNIDRDDWRWDSGGNSPNIPTYTLAPAGASSLVLGGQNSISIASGTTATYLCSMYAGQAYLRVRVGSGPANIDVQVTPQPASLFASQALAHFQANKGTDATITLALPRGPCTVLLDNTNGGGQTAGANFEMVAIET